MNSLYIPGSRHDPKILQLPVTSYSSVASYGDTRVTEIVLAN